MRNVKLLLPVIALSLLLLAGCSDRQEQEATTMSTLANGGNPTSVAVEHESKVVIVDYEVRVTKEGFFPATYEATDGEALRLAFLFDEAHFVTIEEIGFAEEVQHTTLDLFFPGPGEYDLICLDCEDKPLAVIRVK